MNGELLQSLAGALLTLALNATLLFAVVLLAERRWWSHHPARDRKSVV